MAQKRNKPFVNMSKIKFATVQQRVCVIELLKLLDPGVQPIWHKDFQRCTPIINFVFTIKDKKWIP
jgi:hypothetical protein